MDIIFDLLVDISKYLVCGAVNQLHYSFCFNGFVKELEQEEVNFTETKRSVEDRVTHARKQILKTAEVMDKWLENANIDVEEVNRLLKEAKAKKNCCFGYCPNWIWRYRLGKKLANKKMGLQKIIQEGRQYIQLERTASIPSNTLDILIEKCMNFESRKITSDQLMEALKDDGVAMIGLYGMGGCGKTTLAMEIKKMAEDEHLFDKIIFVPVSSTVEVPRIQEKIASSLEYKFPENEEMERAQRLCMRLIQEKNILMILDDVWEKLDFGRIGIPSFEHHKGCKILITTRSEEVCTSMDCQRKISLSILTDEEAWTLFQKKALISEDTPETFKHLAKQISDECKGLPVAIAAIASSLKDKEEVLWRVALNRLRSSKPINIGKGLQDPYKCLQLSYDNLDSKEAKSLFLLCSVFPEDYDIPVECLIRCAIGLGVAGEVNSYENARSEVMAAKIKLVSSCLISDAMYRSVKMHDLVRDVAQWIAKNENNIIMCETEKDVTLEQSPIKYLWCVKFSDDMDCSNLEFLCIRAKLEVSDEIFERMRKLRVLIITSPKKYDKLPLPTRSFKTLTNLRCIILQYWELSDISFVRDLKKLQSLSLHGCSWPPFIDMQTVVAFTQLQNLKLIEVNGCDIEIKNLEEIKRIPLLEELYIIQTGSKYNDRKFIECFNLFSFVQTLQSCSRLKQIIGDVVDEKEERDEIIEENKHIKTTSIPSSTTVNRNAECFVGGMVKMNDTRNKETSNSKDNTCHQAQNSTQIELPLLQELKLDYIPNYIIPYSYYVRCPSLDTLSLRVGRYVGFFTVNSSSNASESDYIKIKISSSNSLHLLESAEYFSEQPQGLNLLIMRNITMIILKGFDEQKYLFNLSVASLFKLQILSIENCSGLRHIIDIGDEYESKNWDAIFPNLKYLSVENCEQLEYMIGQYPLDNKNYKEIHLHLPTLEELKLDDLPNFISICATKSLSMAWPSLKKFDCDGCSRLVNISTSRKDAIWVQNHFLTLETLRMDNAKVEAIFCLNGLQMMGQQVNLKLEDLDLKNLPQMTNIWEATKNTFTLQHLQSLQILRCEKLEVIFPPCVSRCLPVLNRLRVRECKELRQIIEEDLEDKKLSNPLSSQLCFPKLASLIVEQCHKLKYLTSVSASNHFPNLDFLLINGATELLQFNETGKTQVELPQLKVLIFIHLSKFCQETQFLNVKHRIVRNCPKLSLTSTTNLQEIRPNFHSLGFKNSSIDWWEFSSVIDRIEESDGVSTSNNELPLSQYEQDYMPENTSPLQMNQEDPPTSENKPCSAKVNNNNQSMLGSTAEMLHEDKKIETKTLVSETEELNQIDRKSGKISYIQVMEQNLPVTSCPNMIELENVEDHFTETRRDVEYYVRYTIKQVLEIPERLRGYHDWIVGDGVVVKPH
ncbi:hypothetical protein VNO80_06329 [Phaseolus coccineus]|uniref:NB-ARC domain-containing protein n=1 Tax=Phaseolus coccineus TaxID=3886 RepID=A0AAN9NNL5_PHACN